MAYNNHAVNENQIASFLVDALKNIEGSSVAEIESLNEIAKMFKKNVPFSKRKYVSAYLLKLASGGRRFNRDRNDRTDRFANRDRNERMERRERSERIERDEHPHTPRVQIDPSLATTIFIGIGRNRRVFPRDLLGLLVSVAGLDRERVGEIRVFTSYSFVQLYTEDCEKTIAALNGYDYRGRKLSVSYSRKSDEASEDSSSESKSYENESSGLNEETIPSNVTNTAHADTSANNEMDRLAAEQSEFAARQTAVSSGTANDENIQPFFETTDDGQVKSRFGNSN
ncbi:MAG: DbpA RNA binding domain-containing protein [Treponema sp.]|nr:DbpA RNA binding domain-containing protein [Treponema sp.]